MNRTIKDATVSRYHDDTHGQMQTHLHDFIAAYNFARRLKTLKGLTPYVFLCKKFLAEPARFKLDPIHQMPGPYIYRGTLLNLKQQWYFNVLTDLPLRMEYESLSETALAISTQVVVNFGQYQTV